jgi:hypothetical protein
VQGDRCRLQKEGRQRGQSNKLGISEKLTSSGSLKRSSGLSQFWRYLCVMQVTDITLAQENRQSNSLAVPTATFVGEFSRII